MRSSIFAKEPVRLLAVLASLFLSACGHIPGEVRGAYFGQSLPGETPVLFAPAVLNSLSPWVEATEFSPDGSQVFLAVGEASYAGAKLYYAKRVKDEWTPFVAAPFVSNFTYSNEPVFSADGGSLMFTGKQSSGTKDLWTVAYAGQGWGTPAALPAPVNSGDDEYRGSYMADGTFYFGRTRDRMMQVYKAYRNAGQTQLVELLGAPVNTNSYEGDPCVAPDGRFLIFYSARNGKSSDLYVSFRDPQGGWGTPVDLGPRFNSPDDEYGAHLSSDGKYLFYTRHSRQGNSIYWVATSAIDKLKP